MTRKEPRFAMANIRLPDRIRRVSVRASLRRSASTSRVSRFSPRFIFSRRRIVCFALLSVCCSSCILFFRRREGSSPLRYWRI